MISQSFEPSRGRVAEVLVQKLLRAVEAEKRGLGFEKHHGVTNQSPVSLNGRLGNSEIGGCKEIR